MYCGGRGNFTPDFYQDSIRYKYLSCGRITQKNVTVKNMIVAMILTEIGRGDIIE